MYNVSIPDELYQPVALAAAAVGQSIDAFIADAVQLRLQESPNEDLDWFFTPQVIAEVRAAAIAARTGKNLTPLQVESHFAAKRESWRDAQTP